MNFLTRLPAARFIATLALAMIAAFAFSMPAYAANDADGDGAMSVTPDEVVEATTDLSFSFDFVQDHNYPLLQRATKSFLLPFSRLTLLIPSEWTAPQLTDSSAPGYVRITQGPGGGPLRANTCNFSILDVTISSTSDGWVINIPQHCGFNDHLLISYQKVTAPEAGVYEFTAKTRAGLNSDTEIAQSPVVTVTPASCPEGQHASGADCVPDVVPTCPQGYVLSNEDHLCYEEGEPSGPVQPTCEVGEYNSETRTCVLPDPVPPLDCPEGYHMFEGQLICTSDENPDETAQPICPEGMTFNGNDAENLGMCVPSGDVEDPLCPEHFSPNDEGMCVFVPFPPSCPSGMHTNEEVTMCLEDEEPPSGGGPTIVISHSRSSSNNSAVLGAETEPEKKECPAALTQYLRAGKENDPEQVKILQTFLNGELGLTLAVDGTYGPETVEAVNTFQLKYWEDVLLPWVPFGGQDHTPTGYVYKLTLWKVNAIRAEACGAEVPAKPELP